MQSKSQRIELVALTIILLLAAVLRMGWPGLTEFKADEARLLKLSLDLVEGQDLPMQGIDSSVGFANFPMSVWLYALPLLVCKHVYSATVFTGLLNTLSVLGCWWLVRRYWGATAALSAALMYAVSPWAIICSRKIWAQNLLPLFVVGWAIGAALTFVERRPKAILLHLFCAAVVVQIHLAAVGLLPATLLLMLVFWRRVSWRWVFLGAAVTALSAAPFVYNLYSQGSSLNDALDATEHFATITDLTSLRYTRLISLGQDIHSLAGPSAFRDYLAQAPNVSLVHWLWGGLMFGGLLWLGWQSWQKRESDKVAANLIVLVWLLAPPLFFVRHSTPVFPHYFIATYPAQYIAAGVLFAAIAKRLLRWPSWGVLLSTAAAQVYVWAVLLSFLGKQATPGAFGAPLALKLQAVGLAQTMQKEALASEIIIVGLGESAETNGTVAVYDVLLRNTARRFVNASQSTVLPAQPAVVILVASDSVGAEPYLALACKTSHVPLRTGEGTLPVLLLAGQAAPDPPFEFVEPNLLANGVRLLGYDVSPDNTLADHLTWQVYWRAETIPQSADYHFFNHLLDANDQRVGQADAAAFSSQQWRIGDTMISHFALPWSEDFERPLGTRTGMYVYPTMENIPVLDIAANPYADGVKATLP